MDLKISLKEYIPVITVFLAAFLAYLFGNRKYKSEQFHKNAMESLTDFYSPIFHEMRKIKLNLDSNKDCEIISIINIFVKSYTLKDTFIFKSCNPNVIQLFYDLDENLTKSESIDKDKIINLFESLYIIVESEYWDIHKSLYANFPWLKFLNKINPIFRFFLELTKSFYDIALFLIFIVGSTLYITFFNKIFAHIEPPEWIKSNTYLMFMVCCSIFSLAIILRIPYYISTMNYKKENKYVKNINNKYNKKTKYFFSKLCEKIKKIFLSNNS